ncbi:hypothetical protein BRADI_2g05585v3 [Brachypodium distachyon]|uniref:Uncharacterized protein n=1 Tax=Brachypodium distachyon TaxID=15368 RepID=A0A0Q3JXA1_BRADI|nr:hypothetical protein BRADI_2g05585v3 [Brachypodium distachyon]
MRPTCNVIYDQWPVSAGTLDRLGLTISAHWLGWRHVEDERVTLTHLRSSPDLASALVLLNSSRVVSLWSEM